MNTTKQTYIDGSKAAQKRRERLDNARMTGFSNAPDEQTGEGNAPREIVQVGWDGRSQPIYRYRDELHLNEWLQARVFPPQNMLPIPNLKS